MQVLSRGWGWGKKVFSSEPKGKIAIITGAGRGRGKASAMEMAMQGASLIILSRTLSELKQTADEIKALGATVISIKTDVSKSKDIEGSFPVPLPFWQDRYTHEQCSNRRPY